MPKTAKVIRLEPEVQRHVRSRLVRLPALAHALHERAKALLAARLEAYFDAADDAMFDLADNAHSNQEQNAYFDAMREVRVQRKSIEKRFLGCFDEAFARLVAIDQRDSLVPDGELSADALSLVQNDDLEQLVAKEDVVARATGEVNEQLTPLNRILQRMVPLAVNVHTSPLGPEILCAAFVSQVKRLDVDIKAKLVLFKLFDKVAIQALPSLYEDLTQLLKKHGVGLQPQRPPRPQPKEDASGKPKVVEVSPLASVETSPIESHPHAALLKLLSFVQKLPPSALSRLDVSLEQILDRVQKHQGSTFELSAVEKETVRLVGMLFDFVMREPTLAKPIKELLVRLRVPVLRVALLDGDFLMNKNHCARKLLNELTSQAVGWQNSGRDVVNDLFVRCITRVVEKVVTGFDRDFNVFTEALAEFSSFVEKERRRSAVLEKRMVDAEDGKARSEQARKRVAMEVQSRLDGVSLPAIVVEFIKGPWSNVLFVTGLKNGYESPSWNESLTLLEDLLWSMKPKSTSQERQSLIVNGPKILQRLRDGLDAVSYNPFEVSDLLVAIEECHIERIRKPSQNTPDEADSQKAPLQTTNVSLVQPQVPEVPVAEANAIPKNDPHMLMVASFAQGAWFDIVLEQGQAPARCRLAAYIKPTGKYIFVNRTGMKTAEKSREELAMALKNGLLHPVDNGMLFEKALENIVTGLRHAKPASPLDSTSSKHTLDDMTQKPESR